MSGHTLSVTLEPGTPFLACEVRCHEPKGAFPCRVRCPEDCETFDRDHEHELVPYEPCAAAEWIEAVGVEDSFDGDYGVAIHDGMRIKVWHNGDGYVWQPEDKP